MPQAEVLNNCLFGPKRSLFPTLNLHPGIAVAEGAVGFELVLVEQLVDRRLVGKSPVARAIFVDVVALVPCHRELYVQTVADLFAARRFSVVDSAVSVVTAYLLTSRT